MKKGILALLFTTLAVIFIIIGFFSPWYNFQMEVKSNLTKNSLNYDISFYLSRAVFKGEVFGSIISQTYDYNNIKELISQIPEINVKSSTLNQILGIFETTFFIVFLTAIFSIAALLNSVGTIFYIKKFNIFKNFNMFFLGLYSSLALCAIFYYMFSWNSLIKRGISLFISVTDIIPIPSQLADMSFWYNYNLGKTEISMGPGFARYLLIFGAIFGLIAFILSYKNTKSKELSEL